MHRDHEDFASASSDVGSGLTVGSGALWVTTPGSVTRLDLHD
jgi:hypothetical protein